MCLMWRLHGTVLVDYSNCVGAVLDVSRIRNCRLGAHMRNWTTSVIAAAAVIFLGWYSGADYLVRGPDQAFWVAEALGVSVWLHFYRKLARGQRVVRLPLRVNRTLWTAAVFLLVLADGWYAGVNIGARGEGPAGLLAIAAAFAGLTWYCPVWTPIESIMGGHKH